MRSALASSASSGVADGTVKRTTLVHRLTPDAHAEPDAV
jgi:hypothetical protein